MMKKEMLFALLAIGFIGNSIWGMEFPSRELHQLRSERNYQLRLGCSSQLQYPQPPLKINPPCKFDMDLYESMWKSALAGRLKEERYNGKDETYLKNYEDSLLSSLESQKEVITQRLYECRMRQQEFYNNTVFER